MQIVFFHKAWWLDPEHCLCCCLLVAMKRHLVTSPSYTFFTKFLKKNKTSPSSIIYQFDDMSLSSNLRTQCLFGSFKQMPNCFDQVFSFLLLNWNFSGAFLPSENCYFIIFSWIPPKTTLETVLLSLHFITRYQW